MYSVVDRLFAYKVMEFDDVRTAFIVDVFEKTAANFTKAVKYLIKNEKKNFDLVLYVGHLPFSSYGPLLKKSKPTH